MTADLIERYSTPVPRYTSYPTAPHFHAGITPQTYGRWLGEVGDDATIVRSSRPPLSAATHSVTVRPTVTRVVRDAAATP